MRGKRTAPAQRNTRGVLRRLRAASTALGPPGDYRLWPHAPAGRITPIDVPRTAMARTTTWLLALVLTCTTAAAAPQRDRDRTGDAAKAQGSSSKGKAQPASARPGEDRERWKWWLYDRAELGITDAQSAAINDIFEANIQKLREARQELDRAEQELSRTIKEHTADIATVSLLLDRVESVRSQHNKLRTLMLYRIHALLSAEQRAKLEALRARQNAARGDRPGDRR